MRQNKYTTQSFGEITIKYGYELLSEFISIMDPIIIKCIKCKTIKKLARASAFKLCCNCKTCEPQNLKYTIDNVKKIIEDLDYNIISIKSSTVAFYKAEIKISCNKCNTKRAIKYLPDFRRNPQCDGCRQIKQAQKMNNFIIEIIDNFKLLNTNIYIKNIDVGTRVKNSRITLCCNICDRDRTLVLHKSLIITKQICKFCNNQNRKYTLEYVKNYCIQNNFQYLDNYYNNPTENHNFLCKNNHNFNVSFAKLMTYIKENRNGCMDCFHNSQRLSEDYIFNILKDKNLNLISKYKNCHEQHSVSCLLCNFKWETRITSIIHCDSGCPKCNQHLNEKLTGKFLKELLPNTNIIEQKHFKSYIIYNNKNQTKIVCDYYFILNNNQIIVEYNGQQHYEFIKYFHRTEDRFNQQKLRDQWLRTYCIENNIILIEIDGRIITNNDIKSYLFNKISELK